MSVLIWFFHVVLESKILNKSLVGMSKGVNSLFLYIIGLISHMYIIYRNSFQSSHVLQKGLGDFATQKPCLGDFVAHNPVFTLAALQNQRFVKSVANLF